MNKLEVTITYPFPVGTDLMQIADAVFEQSEGHGLCFERNGRVYVAMERQLVKYGVINSVSMQLIAEIVSGQKDLNLSTLVKLESVLNTSVLHK